MDAVLFDTAQRLFDDHSNNTDALWTALESNELTRAWIPESQGGHESGARNVFGLIELSAASAPVPFAETLLASYLLSVAELPVPAGKLTYAIAQSDTGISFASQASHIVFIDDQTISLHETPVNTNPMDSKTNAALTSQSGYANTIANAACPPWLGIDVVHAYAALVRASQIVGAASAALELSIEYSAGREQFGRPLSRFQAIQHLLSEAAGEVAAATAACEAAIDAVEYSGSIDISATAVAKQTASEAAGIVAEHCHQIHGAIGYTQEYELARLTQRLWQWRDEHGDQYYWANWLGQQYLESDTTLWAHIATDT